jgi:putative inorganic carbon (HCO3(-)) transporter
VIATVGRSGLVGRAADIAAFLFLVAGVVVVPLLFWPWTEDVFVGPKFHALRLFTAGGAVAAGIWLAVERPTLRFRVSDVAAFAFLLLNVVAYAFSVDRGTSFLGEPLQQGGLVTVFALTGAYAIARVSVRTPRRLSVLFAAAAASATIAAAYGVVQIAGADPVWSSLPKGRVFSTIGQPNWLAAYLVLTIPLTVAMTMTTARRVLRVLGVSATLLQVLVLAATSSRSGYIGLLAVLAVGGVLAVRSGPRVPRSPRRVLVGTVAVVAIGAVLLGGLSRTTSAVAPAELARRAASALDIGAFDSRRYVALWEVGLAIAADNPLTGTGQDTYAIIFPEYRDEILDEEYAEHFARFRPESPHNVYLSVAAGAGFPALAAYVILVGSTSVAILPRAGLRGRESVLLTGLIAALVGHVVTDWFMTADLSGSWLFWALMGAGLALIDHTTSDGEPVRTGNRGDP